MRFGGVVAVQVTRLQHRHVASFLIKGRSIADESVRHGLIHERARASERCAPDDCGNPCSPWRATSRRRVAPAWGLVIEMEANSIFFAAVIHVGHAGHHLSLGGPWKYIGRANSRPGVARGFPPPSCPLWPPIFMIKTVVNGVFFSSSEYFFRTMSLSPVNFGASGTFTGFPGRAQLLHGRGDRAIIIVKVTATTCCTPQSFNRTNQPAPGPIWHCTQPTR